MMKQGTKIWPNPQGIKVGSKIEAVIRNKKRGGTVIEMRQDAPPVVIVEWRDTVYINGQARVFPRWDRLPLHVVVPERQRGEA